MTKKLKAFGNIMYLLDNTWKQTELSYVNDWCFYHLFEDCQSLTQAPKLKATQLADECYEGMFIGCNQFSDCHMKASMQGVYDPDVHGDTTKTVIYDI